MRVEIVRRVETVAEKRGIPMIQVSLAWLLSKPAVSAPILGDTNIKHFEEAVGAVNVTLTEEEIRCLEELYTAHNVVGFE